MADFGLYWVFVKYPDRFVATVACLPMNDREVVLKEIDRAVVELKFRGGNDEN